MTNFDHDAMLSDHCGNPECGAHLNFLLDADEGGAYLTAYCLCGHSYQVSTANGSVTAFDPDGNTIREEVNA